MRAHRLWLAPLLLALALLAGPAAAGAAAQVAVLTVAPLRFGVLVPGVATQVPADAPGGRGELLLQGRGRLEVSITLPPHLEAHGGNRIPLQFGALDGHLESRNRAISFDPSAVQQINLTPGHDEARLFLGGTALPSAAQPAGEYRAEILIVIVNTRG